MLYCFAAGFLKMRGAHCFRQQEKPEFVRSFGKYNWKGSQEDTSEYACLCASEQNIYVVTQGGLSDYQDDLISTIITKMCN